MSYKILKPPTIEEIKERHKHLKALYENACGILAEWAEEFIHWPDGKFTNGDRKAFDCPHDLLGMSDLKRLEAKRPCIELCRINSEEPNRKYAHCSDCWKVYLELTTDFGGKIVQKADSDDKELVSMGVDKS